MRLAALLLVLASTSVLGAARAARAEERKLEIEAEVLGAGGKSVGTMKLVVAARSDGTAKESFGSRTVTLYADVGPTFDKDCNLTTIKVSHVDTEASAKDRKAEMRSTIHACGKGGSPATLSSGNAKVVVTVRPATS